jgi:hypothetical protein
MMMMLITETIWFNIQEICISLTDVIYVFHRILTVNNHNLSKRH